MVWLISFLTVSNIAMGYGLAIYMQRQFGTVVPTSGPLSSKKSAVPLAAPVAAEVAMVSPPAPRETNEAKPSRVQESKSIEPTTDPVTGNAQETSEFQSADEENVLAGIAEFRSQLAKLNEVAEESPEPATAEEELAVAAN